MPIPHVEMYAVHDLPLVLRGFPLVVLDFHAAPPKGKMHAAPLCSIRFAWFPLGVLGFPGFLDFLGFLDILGSLDFLGFLDLHIYL